MDVSDPKTPLIEKIVKWKMNLFSTFYELEGKQNEELEELCVQREAELRGELENESPEVLEKKLQACEDEQRLLAL